MTTTEKLNYKDVSKEWLNNRNTYKRFKNATYYEHNGIKYYVDNKKVVLDYSEKEKEVALWLVNTFGGEVIMVPRINEPENIKTPDYLFNDNKFDLKEIKGNSPYAIDNAIKNNKFQANNFIIDISTTEIDIKILISQIEKIYHSPKRLWVNTIILLQHNKLIKVFQRN